MTTATKKRPAKKKAAKPVKEMNGQLLNDEPDQDRKDVESNIAKVQAERDRYKTQLDSMLTVKKKLGAAQDKVSKAEADFEVCDAARKKAKAAVAGAVANELSIVARFIRGEQLLPLEDADAQQVPEQSSAAPVSNDHAAAESIDALLAKNIKKLVTPEVFDRAKDSDNPIGMTEKQLDILKSKDVKTISDLEKLMRENEWWHRDLKGIGPDKINRLTDTLLAFRQVYPVPSEPEKPAEKPSGKSTADVQKSFTEPKPVTFGVDTQEHYDAVQSLIELIADCDLLQANGPEESAEFAGSVGSDAAAMKDWIVENKTVTADQIVAIVNWRVGVAKWHQPA